MKEKQNNNLLIEANTAFRNKEYSKAIELYNKILILEPKFAFYIRFNLNMAQKKLNKTETVTCKNLSRNKQIKIIDIKNVDNFKIDYISPVTIIMPCTDVYKGYNCAKVLLKRAGMRCDILIVIDSIMQGFVKTLNSMATRINSDYIVYLAQDAYSGLNWLSSAYNKLEETKKGLLGFNDGKWNGCIASFGMVKVDWVKTIYNGPIFYPEYISHKADNELTFIAQGLDMYVYDPNIVLVEYDPDKIFGTNHNPEDEKLFIKRLSTSFRGLVPKERLKNTARKYNVTL